MRTCWWPNKIDPNMQEAHVGRARNLVLTEPEVALAEVQKALATNPNFIDAHLLVAEQDRSQHAGGSCRQGQESGADGTRGGACRSSEGARNESELYRCAPAGGRTRSIPTCRRLMSAGPGIWC